MICFFTRSEMEKLKRIVKINNEYPIITRAPYGNMKKTAVFQKQHPYTNRVLCYPK